jgi:AcrR family transcriptional regulator
MTPAAVSEKDPVRKKILAATERLFAGTPLRSTGRMSVSQLAVEAGVARWHLTHQHTDLKEMFQARFKAAGTDARQLSETEQLKARNAKLTEHCAELEEQLARYAAVINLLLLEKAAADKAPVASLGASRQRRAAMKGCETKDP